MGPAADIAINPIAISRTTAIGQILHGLDDIETSWLILPGINQRTANRESRTTTSLLLAAPVRLDPA
jgi:hypothetical protein